MNFLLGIASNCPNSQGQKQAVELRRSSREHKQPDRLIDIYNNVIYVNFCSTNPPINFEEAMKSGESEFWVEAMNKEIECLNKNNT